MDRTKAIELLKMAVPQDESLDEEGLFIEAVSMAIKALEQVPTFGWLMQKADEWGMAYGKQFLIEAQRAWEGEQE